MRTFVQSGMQEITRSKRGKREKSSVKIKERPASTPDIPENSQSDIKCDFCQGLIKPFPTKDQVKIRSSAELFCCNMHQELYNQILQEMEINFDDMEYLMSNFATSSDFTESKARLAERWYATVIGKLMQKYYSSGQKFLTMLPDGTGNIAIQIIASQGHFVYIIYQDESWGPKIEAFFHTNAHGACYHPNGVLWVCLEPCCGSHSDKQGTIMKQWKWVDYHHHVHAPPYQQIILDLNPHINVRIQSQEQIYVRFEAGKMKVTFNVGAKFVKYLKYPKNRTIPEPPILEEEQFLQSMCLKITSLYTKILNTTICPYCNNVKMLECKFHPLSRFQKLLNLQQARGLSRISN
eukprot:gi/632949232/ref/XP_007890032.1/ PREDICTED: protein FAM194B [Callorhinchus milii]